MDSGTSHPPLRFAATAVPVRDGVQGLEVLMVRRNLDLSFGGMWTFPGGSIDPEDGPIPPLVDEGEQDWIAESFVSTAANASARELFEETHLSCDVDALQLFSHWLPPMKNGPPKRFSTWFFVTTEVTGELVVDTSENSEARWVVPGGALDEHRRREFPIAVPTWITLDDLGQASTVADVLSLLAESPVRLHHTKASRGDDAATLIWQGDVAFEGAPLHTDGPRNRVRMDPNGMVFGREVRADEGPLT